MQQLGERNRAVLDMVMQDKTNKEIVDTLGTTHAAVQVRIRLLCHMFGVKTRTELKDIARRTLYS